MACDVAYWAKRTVRRAGLKARRVPGVAFVVGRVACVVREDAAVIDCRTPEIPWKSRRAQNLSRQTPTFDNLIKTDALRTYREAKGIHRKATSEGS